MIGKQQMKRAVRRIWGRTVGIHRFLLRCERRLMLTAGIICVGFACGDEYHQSFISGRSPAVKDVCIDSFGVFWGIILVRIIGWTGRKTIFRPRPEKKHFKRKNAAACAYEYKQGPDWEEAPVRPKKKRFGRKTKHTGEPQGGYPSENDYGPQDNYYDPENSFRPQDDYCNPDQGSHYGPRNGYYNQSNNYGPQNGYCAPDNSYGPQNGYYDPDNNFGPQNNPAPGYGPEAPVKKKKKEKDWIFDDSFDSDPGFLWLVFFIFTYRYLSPCKRSSAASFSRSEAILIMFYQTSCPHKQRMILEECRPHPEQRFGIITETEMSDPAFGPQRFQNKFSYLR